MEHRHYPMEKGFVQRDTLYVCRVCGEKIVANYNSYCAMCVITGVLALSVPATISFFMLQNGQPGQYSPLVFLIAAPIRIVAQLIYQKFFLKFEIAQKREIM